MKKSLGAKTILHPTPVFIVGTYDAEGKPNVMNAAWGGICCSQPPCVSVSLRAATYSHGAILARKAFTISIASEKYIKEADYFGIASGRNVNKFEDTKLTPEPSNLVDAPYVKEFPLVLECKLFQVHELGLHTQFVGEILDVKVDENVCGPEGYPDLTLLKPVLFAPDTHKYFGAGSFLGNAFEIGKIFRGRE